MEPVRHIRVDIRGDKPFEWGRVLAAILFSLTGLLAYWITVNFTGPFLANWLLY